MRNVGCSGYVLEANKLISLLPKDVQDTYTKAIDKIDCEEVETILKEYWSAEYPYVDGVFIIGDEDDADDLVKGEMYVNFEENSLYTQVPTKELKQLNTKGIAPKYTRWVTWG